MTNDLYIYIYIYNSHCLIFFNLTYPHRTPYALFLTSVFRSAQSNQVTNRWARKGHAFGVYFFFFIYLLVSRQYVYIYVLMRIDVCIIVILT